MWVVKFAMTFTSSRHCARFQIGGSVKDDEEKIRPIRSIENGAGSVTSHLASAGVHLHNEIISFRPRMES